MTIAGNVRDFFTAPANLGVELTIAQIAAKIKCDNIKALGLTLWKMATKTKELRHDKNDDGKRIYFYNPKFKGAKAAPAAGAGRPRKYKKRTAVTSASRAVVTASRWALTQDSAFVDLASPDSDEISGDRARALVDFIRKLDEARA